MHNVDEILAMNKKLSSKKEINLLYMDVYLI